MQRATGPSWSCSVGVMTSPQAALTVKGVTQTATLDAPKPPLLFQTLGGVAVIGNSTWAVMQGRKKLAVQWNDGPHGSFTSEPFRAAMIEKVIGRNASPV